MKSTANDSRKVVYFRFALNISLNTDQTPTDEQRALRNDKQLRGSWLRWFFRLLLGLGIVAFLASRHDDAALLRALRSTSWSFFAVSVGLYWAGQLLSAWKWKLLLRAQNAEIALADCCRLYAVGMFWNLWMPTNIGGDAVRAVRCGALCGSRAVAVSSILVERLTGLVALAFLGSVAFTLQFWLAPLPAVSVARHIALLFALAFAILAGLVWFLKRARHKNSSSPFWKKVASLRESLAFYLRPSQRPILGFTLLISLIFQTSQVALNIFLAQKLGLHIAPLVFFWIVPTLAFASLVPFGIGGLGVREAAAVQMLGAFGASASTILAWSLLWQAVVWFASLPGAIWAAPSRAKHTSSTRITQDTEKPH